MILNEVCESKIKSSMNNRASFQIQSSSKAFKILSSNLYKDAISAVIRELSTNAVDAQVANHTDEPFEVHLPTTEEPMFVVSDKGIGMSESEIYQLYTTYFGSSKASSNEYIGALGLGSKSPFAYTDQFTVESCKNGERNVFSCFLNEENIPTLSKIATTKTTKSGTTVTLPVEKSDMSKFLEKASEIYEVFSTKPVTNIPLPAVKKIMMLEDENYQLYRTSEYIYDPSLIFVVMGSVKYPITLTESISEIPLVKAVLRRSALTLEVQVELGALNIAPSREELSYDTRTKRALYSIFSEVSAQVEKDLVEKIKSFKHKKDAILFKYDNANFLGYFNNSFFSLNKERALLETELSSVLGTQIKTFRIETRNKDGYHSFAFKKEEFSFKDYYRVTYIAIDSLDKSIKRNIRQAVGQYVLDSWKFQGKVILIDSEYAKKSMFSKAGVEILTQDDLPEAILPPRKKSARSASLTLLSRVNLNDNVDIFSSKKKIYYLLSYRRDIEVMHKYVDCSYGRKIVDEDIAAFLKQLNLPIIIISAQEYRLKNKKIQAAKNLTLLTEKKIESILKRKIRKQMEESKDVLIARNLYLPKIGEWLRKFHLLKVEVDQNLATDKKAELEKQRTYRKLVKILETFGVSYYRGKTPIERRFLEEILEKMVKNKKQTAQIREAVEECKIYDAELSDNAFLASFFYSYSAIPDAEKIYKMFVNF